MNPRKKPKFVRHMTVAYRRIKPAWRRPRGIHSKVRIRGRGKIKMPSIGYGAPKTLRYLHPSGFREILISNVNDLKKIDANNEAVKIAHTVGTKKRQEILKKAGELKIRVLNP